MGLLLGLRSMERTNEGIWLYRSQPQAIDGAPNSPLASTLLVKEAYTPTPYP